MCWKYFKECNAVYYPCKTILCNQFYAIVDTICPGDSFTLTASGGTTYQWSTGETTSSITVTPAIGDTTYTYFVSATVGTCSDDTFAIVVIYPLPPADAGNGSEICFGDSAQLSGSGGLFFAWTPGNTLTDSTIFNPIANPTVTTTYTLTVTDINGCKNKDTVVIIVHPLPLVNAGSINNRTCNSQLRTCA